MTADHVQHTQNKQNKQTNKQNLLVKIFSAEETAVASKALFVEDTAAVRTAHAGGVPGLVQYGQHVLPTYVPPQIHEAILWSIRPSLKL